MELLIDASVLIEYERGRLELEPFLTDRGNEELFLSAVTASGLLHEAHRAPDPAVRARRSAWVEAIVERFPMLPVDLAVARSHAQLWAELASRGQMIGSHDLWLAASCIAYGFGFATANMREFERVPGLELEPWRPRG